ncbi:unnamed protein product [Clonostachys rosea f. rosea IK726]|uniref:AB hydrolase-1 domain-containing protein n=2 Tax=Bionectria ochroleuca TaxID=29856 RepID=A0A0B7KS69_BIOOC|nr:unnamed protein product [Clonostachys rosea f. rosea IK726]
MAILSGARYRYLHTITGCTYRYYTSAHPERTTVVLSHGFPYTANIWRWHTAAFEKLGLGCIAPDMLGVGGSEKSENPSDYTGQAIAQSVVEIMSADGVEKAVIIGHDWSSVVGSRLTLFYPSNVTALVLVAAPYWTPSLFDQDAVNTETEDAFGFPIFGYWDILMNRQNLLEKHANSFFPIFFAEDPEAWKKHFVPKGGLEKWLENNCECVVGGYVTEPERKDS